MKLGIITPLNDTLYLSEYTDFDVALGYMAMRYNEYRIAMLMQTTLRRDLMLIQMPGYSIRPDYYIAAARRLRPKYMGLIPQISTQLSVQIYLEAIAMKRKYEELENTTVIPTIGEIDNGDSVAIWSEMAPHRLLLWDIVKSVPLKFSHGSMILGMIPKQSIQQIRPRALITAYPVLCAQRGLSCFDEDGDKRVINQWGISPEWMLQPLTDKQLALAVENIKELKSVVDNRQK